MPEPVLRITSRDAFRQVLADTLARFRQLHAETPDFAPYANIIRQLEAMSRWTDHGRSPTSDERKSIDVALVAVRELEADPDLLTQDLSNRLYELNDYFDRRM